MEMGSNYLTVEGSSTTSSGSSDSLNGLKFGQKIYFEDVGLGVSGKSGGGSSSSSSSPAAAKKGGRRVAQSGQPPRCQVEGCKIDLTDAKAYYSRHKVCGMHSKSPKVIVAGLEQRFCQQCSRFHLLTEFDQGKRSCRRRLAGHNERRRKPPPGSFLSSRLGRLSSSHFDGASRSGGFLLDFSSYARHSGKDHWPGTKASEQVPGSHSTSAGKYLHSMWPGSTEDPSSEMFLPGSAGGSNFSIPSGECITGVTSDSSCALSLLSNQTWGSRNRASSGIELGSSSGLMNIDGAAMSQCTVANSVTVAHLSNNNPSWGFKGHEAHEGLQVVPPSDHHMGLGQISQPLGSQFHSDHLLMDQFHNGGRPCMEVDHSRAYNSAATGHGHWSL